MSSGSNYSLCLLILHRRYRPHPYSDSNRLCWFLCFADLSVRARVTDRRRDRGETKWEKGLCNVWLFVYLIFGPCPFTRQSLALFVCMVFVLFWHRWFLCLLGFNCMCSLLSFNWTCTALLASGLLLTEGFSALEMYLWLLLLSLLTPYENVILELIIIASTFSKPTSGNNERKGRERWKATFLRKVVHYKNFDKWSQILLHQILQLV